jgi:TPR repeat protein
MERMMKRVEANDATLMTNLGGYYAEGLYGLQQDRNKAFELYTRAAELGSSEAHYQIAGKYINGESVVKDVQKAIHHLELAAMAGHESARYYLGCMEYDSGNMERAIKHWIISASAGHSKSILAINKSFEGGHVQSDLYELTMKAHSDSYEEMRSKAREDAAYLKKMARG